MQEMREKADKRNPVEGIVTQNKNDSANERFETEIILKA